MIDEVDIGDPRLLLHGTDPPGRERGSEPGGLLRGGGGEERPAEEYADRQCERRTESKPVYRSYRFRGKPPGPAGVLCTLIPQGYPELLARFAEESFVRLYPRPVRDESRVKTPHILVFAPAYITGPEMPLKNRPPIVVQVPRGGEEQKFPVPVVCHIASFS